MDKKKVFRITVVAVGIVLSCLFVFLLLPRLLVWFLPFVLAYFLAKIIEPLVRLLHKKCKIPRSIGTIISIVLAIGVLGGIIVAVVSRLISEVNDIVAQSDTIIAKIALRYESLRGFLAHRFGIGDALDRTFANLGETLSTYAASHTVPALQGAFDVVKSIPSAIVFAVVFLLGTYFMSSDRERIAAGLHRTIPPKIMGFVDDVMQNVFSALGAYIRAQLVLICITFCELSMGVMIIGGSRIAYYLTKMLIADGSSVKIIDKDPEVCQRFSDEMPKAEIVFGDGAQQELLLEEGIKDTSAFISLTGIDEENILISVLASSFNVPKVITKINRDELHTLSENLGLDTIISPKKTVSDLLVGYARALRNSLGSNIETLYRLMDDHVEAIEFKVSSDFERLDTPLKDMRLKENILIAGIIRNKKPIIPTGNDVILSGDKVIVIAADRKIQELSDILK